MQLKDAEGWQKAVGANQDFYGKGVMDYALRWADLMEARMAEGAAVAAVAEQASDDADTEGISGFMYGCAVSTLAQVWVHGEALRRWHNHDIQIGSEGDTANEDGGVLNPALVTITMPD